MTAPQQFLIYQSEDGSTRIDVMLVAETLWLKQKQLTELFGKAKGTISEHIKHIFEDCEQDEKLSCSVFPNNCQRKYFEMMTRVISPMKDKPWH